MTLFQIKCFRVNILKNCSMFSMPQCFSMFIIFFNFFFGQKRRSIFHFRTNLTLLIKNRKPNMGLNIGLLWTIFCNLKMLTIYEKIPTLEHWNKHWNILKNNDWHRIEFQCSLFDIENIGLKSMSMLVQTLSVYVHFQCKKYRV